MADKRIIQLPNTPGVDTATDWMAVDNVADGTRRIPVGRAGGPAILDANGMPLTATNEAVVESGGGSSGYYVKLADGTLISRNIVDVAVTTIASTVQGVTIYRKGEAVWLYPVVSFVEPPVLQISAVLYSGTGTIYQGPTMTKIRHDTTDSTTIVKRAIYQVHAFEDFDRAVIFLLAIGRWK